MWFLINHHSTGPLNQCRAFKMHGNVVESIAECGSCRPAQHPTLRYVATLQAEVPGFWDKKHREMHRRHAISQRFSGHYQDLGAIRPTLLFLAWTREHQARACLALGVTRTPRPRLAGEHLATTTFSHVLHRYDCLVTLEISWTYWMWICIASPCKLHGR